MSTPAGHPPLDEGELARLRLAVHGSGEIVFMTDPKGLFTFVNPEFVRVYGYQSADVVGRTTPRILKSGTTTVDDYADFWARLVRCEVVRRDFVNRTKDGAILHVECSANPIVDEHGTILGFLAVQRDVTGRRSLDQQLLESQKMEAIGRLAGGVAHDFNNLLTVILGYAEQLDDDFADPSLVRADIEEIKAAGRRAAQLTRQLLAFSRRQTASLETLDIGAVALEFRPMLARLVGEDVQLSVSAERDRVRIVADVGQIEQILLNLTVNARDAMPKGGELRIAIDAARGHASLIVKDSGCGMSADVLARAFEPFFTTKPVDKGTGLGLSIVYGIVRQSGGHVSIESQPDSGTAVKIRWPLAPEAAGARTEETGGPVVGGTETILLVEDEVSLRSLIRRVLEGCGYRILEARDPEDAIGIAAGFDGAIDLLLADVMMPGLNGPDVAQRVVASRPDTKVMYVSGFPSSLLNQQHRQGRLMVLPKPFTAQVLASTVRRSLDS